MLILLFTDFKENFDCGDILIVFFFLFQDKTFGIKNKKGAKQQKFIQQVQVQVSLYMEKINN